ncbi:MAG: ABC transporter substrate-binding protein [Candidatus Tectimicrobiota bacterium]
MLHWKLQGQVVGILSVLCLTGTLAWGQPAPATAKLERLKVAIAPLGWDTNFTWLQSQSGQLDKRPALEYLVGIDPRSGAYIPQLAEKWEMSPDARHWTISLRKGVKFHEDWGEFTARDVRHSVFLLTQPEAIQTATGLWRSLMGISKSDSGADILKKVEAGVEIVHDHQVVFHLQIATPELLESIAETGDLPMESKKRWDAGGKELYGQKVVSTGPFEFVERKVGSHVLYKRVENHWRQTPAAKELEFRWVQEGVTRLASLLAEEVHISDVERALQKDAVAKGMKVIPSTQPSIQHWWSFGGMYFSEPERLDPKSPLNNPDVRQAMNMAINRKALADGLLGGRVQPLRINGYHAKLDSALWPGLWNPDWDTRAEELYGYNPIRARELLKKAGYGNGFEFTVYLYTLPGMPEQIDIGQALALDWEAIGLKPKLIEIDFPRVREKYRTKTMHGAIFPLRNSLRTIDTIRVINTTRDSTVHAYLHPEIEKRIEALKTTADLQERARLFREIGDHKFNNFAEIPLFWLFSEATVNPKYVAEYPFPGLITGFFTHLEYVKPAQ